MMDITNGVIFDRTIKEGFKFNGFDTTENDMYLISRSAPTPSEKEIIENIPFVQGAYDFSNILGERIFDNRTISYTFQIYERDYERRKHDQTVLQNKLMNTHITRLEDTHDSSYYYLGKCVSVNVEDDHEYGRLIVNIDFGCYPFKISKLPEGHDIWDEFNFELDVAQQMTYYPIQSTFKPLEVGDKLTIGMWARQFDGGYTIQRDFQGRSYMIDDVRSTDDFVSERAYYVSELDRWVIEQDIVEAQDGNAEFTLINPGTATVVPTIELSHNMTIIKNNEQVYNVQGGTIENDLLALEPGENHFVVAVGRRASGNTITFNYHKELI